MSNTYDWDRREFERERTSLVGSIVEETTITRVFVVEMSLFGAKLRIRDGDCPKSSKFKLRIHRVGKFDVHLRWRDGRTLGVQFEDAFKEIGQRISAYRASYPAIP